MKRVGRFVIVLMTVLALVFPASANAWPGEGLVKGAWNGVNQVWEGTKDVLGWTLETVVYGPLEVGWMGIYGAGCGVKNLATWDGTACATGVAESGDKFRSIIHDIDECVAAAAVAIPSAKLAAVAGVSTVTAAAGLAAGVTLLGYATGETKNPGDEDQIGLTPGEAKKVIVKAAEKGTSSPGIMNWMRSTGGIKAIANNPIWSKVPKALPLVDKIFLVHKIVNSCGKLLEFAVYGVNFLVTGKEVRKRDDDGTWLHCTTKCVFDAELNAPGCYPVRVKADTYTCSWTKPVAAPTPTKPMGPPTTVPLGSGPHTVPGLTPVTVPGGSVAGSCALLIRELGTGGALASATDRASCLGTSDRMCQELRAQAASGAAIFPLDPKVQRRCFG